MSSPWGWWRGLHFMSGRKRLLLLWQLGRQPSTETSSSRRGCWPLKTCAKPTEDHPPREESTPLSLLRPPADTSILWPDEPAWPSPAAPKARPTRILHGPLLTRAGIVLFMKMMQKCGGVPNVGSKALNNSSLLTHRGLFGAECKGGCWLPREQTPTRSW